MYIYKFTHIDSKRCYIGQTIQNPNQRRLEHISDSKYTTREYHFHNALRKYGIDSFTFEVIDKASTLEELNLLEEKYVKQFDSINKGFNIRQAGGNKLHSEASKKRMSEAQKLSHAKRKAEGKDTFVKTKKTAGWTWSKEQKAKLKLLDKSHCKGRTWKLINGTRVWFDKEASV
jgi:group I intron endonuclease